MLDGWKVFELIKEMWLVFAVCFVLTLAQPKSNNRNHHNGPPRNM